MLNIFVASSSAAKTQAKVFIEDCKNPNINFMPWWEQFTAGGTLLGDLESIKNKINAAILLFTPEALSTTPKGKEIVIPNLNVLFEFGFLYSALGRDKVSIVKYSNVELPTDLGGYIHIKGSKFFKPNGSTRVGKATKADFDRWINSMLSKI